MATRLRPLAVQQAPGTVTLEADYIVADAPPRRVYLHIPDATGALATAATPQSLAEMVGADQWGRFLVQLVAAGENGARLEAESRAQSAAAANAAP